MKNRIEPPEAIIVTLPRRFFQEQDHATYLREIEAMNTRDTIWYRVMRNLPVHDVLYVYTIIENKVHHRAQFCGLIRNETMRFSRPDGKFRTFENANAVMMCAPVIMAPHDIPIRGFQGFRYSKILF